MDSGLCANEHFPTVLCAMDKESPPVYCALAYRSAVCTSLCSGRSREFACASSKIYTEVKLHEKETSHENRHSCCNARRRRPDRLRKNYRKPTGNLDHDRHPDRREAGRGSWSCRRTRRYRRGRCNGNSRLDWRCRRDWRTRRTRRNWRYWSNRQDWRHRDRGTREALITSYGARHCWHAPPHQSARPARCAVLAKCTYLSRWRAVVAVTSRRCRKKTWLVQGALSHRPCEPMTIIFVQHLQ